MRAMDWVSRNIPQGSAITVETVRYVHELCLSGFVEEGKCRGFRTQEPYPFLPGGQSRPPDDVPNLMGLLCNFVSDNMFSPIGQSSVFHFEFEKIYPFDEVVDLTGLALSYAILFRRGLVCHPLIVPFSWLGSVDSLCRKSLLHPYGESEHAYEKNRAYYKNKWAIFNSRNTVSGVKIVKVFLSSAAQLEKVWLSKLPQLTANSTARKLLLLLLGTPRVSVSQAASNIGKSFSATNEALNRLEQVGIVTSHALNGKERVFIAEQSVALIEEISLKLKNTKQSYRDSFKA